MFEVTKTGVLENLQKLFESTTDVPDELFEQVMLQKLLILKTATYGKSIKYLILNRGMECPSFRHLLEFC
jgi:hypothetical protein